MALDSNAYRVYVALTIGVFFWSSTFLAFSAGSGVSSGSATTLLPAYDFLYYMGVRAYFFEEWDKAAENFEKSISIRETIRRTRRKCYDECLSAGDDILSYLGNKLHECGVFCWHACGIVMNA